MTNGSWEKIVTGLGDLAGRVVFIAGVGPQMGSACARIAVREAASAIFAARTSVEPLAAEIRAAGGHAIAITCDLTDKESLRAAVEQGAAAFGPVDGVFYNAGYYDNDHDTIDIDDDEWRMTIDVNYTGAHTLARLVMPGMLAKGHGSFVFNSSAASLVAAQVRFGYQVAKAGVNALTRFIAAKFGRSGIRANATLPFVVGGVAGQQNCLGRSGFAEEIGKAVVFLLSDRASIITGQVIHLDGGLFARASWPTNAAPFQPPVKAEAAA